MKDWNEYNSKLITNSIELIKENKNSDFNSEEKRCYSHIRDLVAITIANIEKKTNKNFRLRIKYYAMVKYSK